MNHIDIFQNHFKAVFPELFLITAITIMLLYAVLYNPSAKHKYPIMTTATAWLSVQTLLIAIALTVPLWGNRTVGPLSVGIIFNNVLITDDFTVLIKTIILLSALSSILVARAYIVQARINSFEYIILILFSTLSMLFIVSSYDLISMYLAIELQSLSFYVIAAFPRHAAETNEFSTEAGLKYFILGALSSGLLLFGESILYGFTGITNFEELTKLFVPFGHVQGGLTQVSHSDLLSSEVVAQSAARADIFAHDVYANAYTIIGLFFILVAFLFKISAAPFHMWTPDVYEGAPTSVTAFFAITPKIAVLSLLLRLCLYTFYDLIESWQEIIIVCSLLSMFVGTFGALNQKKIKRLFAYSSIAHVGYLLIGLATGTIEAVESLLVYILIYILMIINVFGILLVLSKHDNLSFSSLNAIPTQTWYKFRHWPKNGGCPQTYIKASNPIWDRNVAKRQTSIAPWTIASLRRIGKREDFIAYITDLSSLSKTNPILAATAAIVFFSNAGVPPLAGFYGKFNVFLAAVEASMYFVALAGVICSVIGAFYSIRLVKMIYFHSLSTQRPNQHQWTWYRTISKENSIILAITFFFTIFFFLYPSFLFTITHSAALCLA